MSQLIVKNNDSQIRERIKFRLARVSVFLVLCVVTIWIAAIETVNQLTVESPIHGLVGFPLLVIAGCFLALAVHNFDRYCDLRSRRMRISKMFLPLIVGASHLATFLEFLVILNSFSPLFLSALFKL